MKKGVIWFLFMVLQCNSALLFAQIEPEEIKQDQDKFQDAFYESLLQKGIENHDKAITSLEECLKLKPNDATVYFELGKNYFALKEYKNAYDYFEKATQLDPKNRWFWAGMYDVNYETKDYEKAIITVEKLIEFKDEYKEDLTSLYMTTQQFDKALSLINELNEKVGKTDRRESYKAQIMQDSKYQSVEKISLLEQIKKNPKVESNYLDLIYIYSQSNQSDKAMEIAKKLEEAIPTSDWAQVSLFQFYINNNDGNNAVKAMNVVFGSTKIDGKIKLKILNEFLIFVNANPQFEPDLEKAISHFEYNKSINVTKEIAQFYYKNKKWDKAINYFESNIKDNSEEDLATILQLYQCYIEINQFDILEKKAEKSIDLFPSQPQFYYFVGLSNNQLKNYKKAKDFLEMGMDYLVENRNLEINFNIQLGEAYNGLGDKNKKDLYFSKANQLLKLEDKKQ